MYVGVLIWVLIDSYVCKVIDCLVFFFQAEDGIRDLVRSRGLGDVYKRQGLGKQGPKSLFGCLVRQVTNIQFYDHFRSPLPPTCLLYTSDAADDLLCVDLGGRRIIKKKKC